MLKHILESSTHKMKIAIIVHNIAELNIDTKLVQRQNNSNKEVDVTMPSMI